MRVRTAAALAIACIGIDCSVPAGQAGAQFEVVSVKPCPAGSTPGGVRAAADRVRIECSTVQELIRMAYVVYPDGEPLLAQYGTRIPRVLPHEAQTALTGGPAWIRSRAFTIEAKAAAPSAYEAMCGPMLRDALKKRFKLRAHEQTRPLAVYELAQSRGGARLRPATEGNCIQLTSAGPPPRSPSAGKAPPAICGSFTVSPAGGIDAHAFTLAGLCVRLSQALDRDVIDNTGLGGVFDLHLDTTLQALEPAEMRMRERPRTAEPGISPATDLGSSVLTALRGVGLTLKPGTRLAKQVVIDYVEMPGEN